MRLGPPVLDRDSSRALGSTAAGAYRNGLKAQVVAFNRELAVAYTDKINELLADFETSQVLAEIGKHSRITAEVNISNSKDEDTAMIPFRLSEGQGGRAEAAVTYSGRPVVLPGGGP